jgi:hypothetical protein
MKSFLSIVILMSFISCNSDKKTTESIAETEKPNSELIGIYEFKTSEPRENHYITIDTLNGEFAGLYFGTEDGKEHGISYYGNKLENLIIKKNKIQFEIGKRNLYESTLFRIVKHKRELENDSIIGVSKSRLKYKGEILKNKFILNCESEFQNCWKKELTFEKLTE